jgi:hypothetical protein
MRPDHDHVARSGVGHRGDDLSAMGVNESLHAGLDRFADRRVSDVSQTHVGSEHDDGAGADVLRRKHRVPIERDKDAEHGAGRVE